MNLRTTGWGKITFAACAYGQGQVELVTLKIDPSSSYPCGLALTGVIFRVLAPTRIRPYRAYFSCASSENNYFW